MNKIQCYYMPKQIMSSDYSSFSIESKMLFSIIFTNAKHVKTIMETADLIERIGAKELYNMRRCQELLEGEKTDQTTKSEEDETDI